jgi:hypothetical protein
MPPEETPIFIEGYAVVSADGMIAAADRRMDALKVTADTTFFLNGLDRANLLVHGRNSQEDDAGAARRRRLIVTRKIAGLADHPTLPAARLWNPAGASFLEACRSCGVYHGTAAVTGGPDVFALFLEMGFDAFHLSRVASVTLPGGRPVFPQVPARTPDDVLRSHQLAPGPTQVLDAPTHTTLVTWRRSQPDRHEPAGQSEGRRAG